MPVKSNTKTKSKAKPKTKAAAKAKSTVKKGAAKTKPVKKTVKKAVKTKPVKKTVKKSAAKSTSKTKAATKNAKSTPKASTVKSKKRTVKTKVVEAPVEVTRTVNLSNQIRKPAKASRKSSSSLSSLNSNPFTFMKAPRPDYAFEVGDTVEVFCDHEKGRERVRGWIKGIVVQVDNKMVAVQFRSNVFLTDGWMVPDRILWYPLNSEHIRPVSTGKKSSAKKEKDIIPDY